MAANNLPIVPISPVIGQSGAVANSNARTLVVGTGTNTAITPVSTNGKRIDAITASYPAGTAAGQVLLFIYDGTNQVYFDEISLPAITPSSTLAAPQATKYYTNLVLPPTYRLFAASSVNQVCNVQAFGGDF